MRGTVTFVVRPAAAAAPGARELRQAVAAAGPALTVTRVRLLADLLERHVAAPRFRLVIAALFAGVAVLLATLGVGAVVAFNVAQRGREYAIRKACGAGPRAVLGAVLRRAAAPVGAGLVLGLVLAATTSRLLEHLLYEVSPDDPVVFGGAAGVLALSAATAAAAPVRRALVVDPAALLREE